MKALLSMIAATVRRSARCRGVADSDDLIQQIALRMIQKDLSAVKSHRAFVGAAIGHLKIDQFRRQRARGGANAVPLDDVQDSPALAYAADQESALLLKQVILALPPLYRDVFILNRFMGLTYAEIAEKYGLSVKAVEYRMSRALALCEEALRD